MPDVTYVCLSLEFALLVIPMDTLFFLVHHVFVLMDSSLTQQLQLVKLVLLDAAPVPDSQETVSHVMLLLISLSMEFSVPVVVDSI